jgi:hypothetical protein
MMPNDKPWWFIMPMLSHQSQWAIMPTPMLTHHQLLQEIVLTPMMIHHQSLWEIVPTPILIHHRWEKLPQCSTLDDVRNCAYPYKAAVLWHCFLCSLLDLFQSYVRLRDHIVMTVCLSSIHYLPHPHFSCNTHLHFDCCSDSEIRCCGTKRGGTSTSSESNQRC